MTDYFKQDAASKFFANLHTVHLMVNGGAYPFKQRKNIKTTVSIDTVIKRINRVLEREHPGEFLRIKKARASRAQQSLGDFYLLNGNRNFIIDHHLDLDQIAKQYKVLESFEQIEKPA
jgi:hypothetical protein